MVIIVDLLLGALGELGAIGKIAMSSVLAFCGIAAILLAGWTWSA
jgi:hypothetical protein